MKKLLLTVLAVVIAAAVLTGIEYAIFEWAGFFAQKTESIRRDVMTKSRAYVEASTRELYRLKIQYIQAKTDAERDAIAALALHEAAGIDMTNVPIELHSFIDQLRNR